MGNPGPSAARFPRKETAANTHSTPRSPPSVACILNLSQTRNERASLLMLSRPDSLDHIDRDSLLVDAATTPAPLSRGNEGGWSPRNALRYRVEGAFIQTVRLFKRTAARAALPGAWGAQQLHHKQRLCICGAKACITALNTSSATSCICMQGPAHVQPTANSQAIYILLPARRAAQVIARAYQQERIK